MPDALLGGARLWLALAGVNGLMAVAAGAFGAHGASDPMAKELLRTGAGYQLAHAVAALAAFALLRVMVGPASWAGWLFGLGGLLFGASLYALALGAPRITGVVTPIGGVLMILGWAAVIYGALAMFATTAPRE